MAVMWGGRQKLVALLAALLNAVILSPGVGSVSGCTAARGAQFCHVKCANCTDIEIECSSHDRSVEPGNPDILKGVGVNVNMPGINTDAVKANMQEAAQDMKPGT